MHGPASMATAGVVDGHMQTEVIGVDAQFLELVGADEQVQRQLLITQVIPEDLRQVRLGALTQCELDGALVKVLVLPCEIAVAALLGQQTLVYRDMILHWFTIAELFQISGQKPVVAVVPPVRKYTV